MARLPGDSALDRLELFTWTAAYLFQNGGQISVQEAADAFGTTPQKVIDAITIIGCAGAMGEASRGLDHDIFDIDWDLLHTDGIIQVVVADVMTKPVQFSARQRAMLLTGLRMLGKHPRFAALPEFHSVIDKLGGVVDEPEAVGLGVTVSLSSPAAQLLAEAQGLNRVKFDYVNRAGGSSTRELDPYFLHSEDDNVYVKGWCYKSNEVRTFDVSRITNLHILTAPVDDTLVSPFNLSPELFVATDNDVVATLELPESAVPLIADFIPAGEQVAITGDTARVRIPFVHVGRLVRLVMGLPGVVRIVDNTEAQSEVRARARAALARYDAA